MSQVMTADEAVKADLEAAIRTRISSLSYLPTTVAVAMKFVELGKNPDAEPADYAKVIEADSSLSSKVLALANSPWFGVRNRVTTVKNAVNLLGLGTIRTMAISYCVAGLHNELRLTPDESRMFWEASLCKAVAAREYAKRVNSKAMDEAFIGGMFQDFSLPVMYATAKEAMLDILQADLSARARLDRERELFHLDHTEIGRILAQKLELPECFVDAVAFHHNQERLGEFMQDEVVADAVYASSLFPHLLRTWNKADADCLCTWLDERLQGHSAEFLEAVQQDFNQTYRYFENSDAPAICLAELMITAAKEVADSTTHLVGTVNQLMQEAARLGMEMHQLVQSHGELEDRATRDALTGVLNREGFTCKAGEMLMTAGRYAAPIALIYVDVDKFKPINDTLGHEFGDRALKAVASGMSEAVRQRDIVGRLGGDEFALMLYDCTEQGAYAVGNRIIQHIAEQVIGRGKHALRISASMGLLFVKPAAELRELEELLSAADKLMYKAKQAGGNRIESQVV